MAEAEDRRTRGDPEDARPATSGPRDLAHMRSSASIDLAHLPPNDPAVYRMLQEADTIGIFQVESRAQMATLPRLQPETLLRHRRRSRDHPARPDRRADGASVSEAAAGAGAGGVSASVARADPRRGRSACRCSRSSCCGWRWSRRDSAAGEAEELRRAFGFKRSEKRMQQIEGQAARGHGSGRGSPATPRRRSSDRSPRSRSTDSPSRTPRASRCSSTRARI